MKLKKFVLALVVVMTLGGCLDREVVQVYKGDPGAPGADGSDGEDGQDGASCESVRQNSEHRVKITCRKGENIISTSYVFDGDDGDDGHDGEDGRDGKSCTATRQVSPAGVNVKCGTGHSATTAFLPDGPAGTPGAAGADGLDAFLPGLSCAVHNLPSWDGSTSLPQAFIGNAIVGTFTLPALNIGDSQASAGFPGMPSSIRTLVGDEGYALDCSGYISIPSTGQYTFKLLSDDGSAMWIENQLVISNQGLHAPSSVTSASTLLLRGPNRINVVYYQGPYTQIALELKWSSAAGVDGSSALAEAVVPAAALTH